jgi:hypothetical protein
MKKLSSISLVILLLATGCGQFGPWNPQTIQGSGTLVTEERAVADFDHVSLAGSGRLTIVQGDEESLTITTDDNLLEHIGSVVSDQKLRIGPERASLRPTRGIDYVLHLKGLRRLDLSGSLSAIAEALTTESVSLHISGSGKIRIGKLETDWCETHVSGSGRVELAGDAATQKLRVSGSGDYGAADLRSQSAEIQISGSGDATVWVASQLDVAISGSGSIGYFGDPKTSSSVSGSGKVRALGAKE